MCDQLPKDGYSVRSSEEEVVTVKWNEIQDFRIEEEELASLYTKEIK